jgi:hypothetical protein
MTKKKKLVKLLLLMAKEVPTIPFKCWRHCIYAVLRCRIKGNMNDFGAACKR